MHWKLMDGWWMDGRWDRCSAAAADCYRTGSLLPLPEEQALHQVAVLPWCARPEDPHLRSRKQESLGRPVPDGVPLGEDKLDLNQNTDTTTTFRFL